MKHMMKRVAEFLEHEDIRFEQINDVALRAGFSGMNGSFDTIGMVDEERRVLSFRTIYPIKASQDKRLTVAETLMRMNALMHVGNFELDMDLGLILFKTSIRFGDIEPDDLTLRHLLFVNWTMVEVHFEAINAVLFGNVSPQRAVEMVKEFQEAAVKKANSTKPRGKSAATAGRWGGRLGDVMGPSSN